ncbi:hypothetical protein GS982_01825 [Rhodococcus hoagii]|uniref:Uncharacterized protein n=1 Tax=Rhodococcus hoagii TaxID=43767 RepID=A0A9Q5EVV6_RHOHA|nr:hypothetical protein [Prescottella equi]NKT77339.1 hypothetical protein [Prescottella equi]NKZ81124.1 hypothetical protein [Prescottella equi]
MTSDDERTRRLGTLKSDVDWIRGGAHDPKVKQLADLVSGRLRMILDHT